MQILHGDNTVASRSYLTDLGKKAKDNNQEIIRLDGKTCTLNDLIVVLESGSLFGQEKLAIIERFFFRQQSNEKKEIIKYLHKNVNSFPNIIFWEPKPVTAGNLKKLGNPKSQLFKIPTVIFKFLDGFFPGNQKNLLLMLESIKKNEKEFVFYMLARRLSQLIVLKDLGVESLKVAPWQKYQLVGQAKKFKQKQLKNLYDKLLKVDTDIKTGQTLMNLDAHLDLLLVSL